MIRISPPSISTGSSFSLARSSLNHFGIQFEVKIRTRACALRPKRWDFDWKGNGNCDVVINKNSFTPVIPCFAPFPTINQKQPSFRQVSAASGAAPECNNSENGPSSDFNASHEMEFGLINNLLQLLHQSAKGFSNAIQCHKLVKNCPELAKAWVGVDVNAWHKPIAYKAAVYALFQSAKEVGIKLFDSNEENLKPKFEVISDKVDILHEDIVIQLNTWDPRLAEWFEVEQLPALKRDFSPLLERWASEYVKSLTGPREEDSWLSTKKFSSVVANILAICCYLTANKLAKGGSCLSFTSSLPDTIRHLMDTLRNLVSMDKMHSLSSAAGFEPDFLAHFGQKTIFHNANKDLIFWLSLVQRKLIAAFEREGVVASLQNKIVENDLAALGLFAYLGRETRLFLLSVGIKDVDEPLKDFLSYLECGSLFIYPELSSISLYQLFLEVVTEEIGWLHLYSTAHYRISHQEKKRSKKPHAIQAEKEMILSAVFTVCFNVFSSFGQFCKTTPQSLDAKLVAFLLRSKNLLSICLEDYWAAYDQSWKLPRVTEISLPELSSGNQDTVNVTISFEEVDDKFDDFTITWAKESMPESMPIVRKSASSERNDSLVLENSPKTVETTTPRRSLLKKSADKLKSASSDIWTGTQLLFIDVSTTFILLKKKICGRTLTKRERKKLRRTLADIASVIPITILMLLPVSAVGHAAILAAIKKYTPCLIPSSYSPERLGMIKQLDRTKKMEVQSWCSLGASSSVL